MNNLPKLIKIAGIVGTVGVFSSVIYISANRLHKAELLPKEQSVIEKLIGPKGDRGETGGLGKSGTKGDQGLKGDKGDKGDKASKETRVIKETRATLGAREILAVLCHF